MYVRTNTTHVMCAILVEVSMGATTLRVFSTVREHLLEIVNTLGPLSSGKFWCSPQRIDNLPSISR